MRLFTLVYGEKYIELMIRALLPSLSWPKNKEALSRFTCWDIYTREEEQEVIEDLVFSLGIPVNVHVIENGEPGQILQNTMLRHIELCVENDCSMFIAPPDSVFGDGSISSILALAEGNDCIAVPHARANTRQTLTELTGEAMSNAQLVGLAWRHLHKSWRQADSTLVKNNAWWGGVSWKEIGHSLYAVTHHLPTVYLAKPTKDDIAWFKAQTKLGAWDHRWPELLVNQGRHKLVCSSDIAFIVELTDEDQNIPPVVDSEIFGNDYRGTLAHHRVNGNSVCVFRGEGKDRLKITVVCVNAGNYLGQGVEYVNKLRDMVVRNLPECDLKFQCFTDRVSEEGYHPGVGLRELPIGLKGWWNKLFLFKEGVFEKDERVLYFDLDTLITGRLDEIAAYQGDFAVLRDFFNEDGIGSGVMAWKGNHAHIWEEFVGSGYQELSGGDQSWIARLKPDADRLQDLYPGRFSSYKQNDGSVPEKSSVVCFHGKPRPHEVTKGWVPKVWKIGGISRADLDVYCNTERWKIIDNVRSASARDLEWLTPKEKHEGHICIVGGSPSINDKVDEIRFMKSSGHTIMAMNGTHDWLLERGITPDYCVLIDARVDNTVFVKNPRKEITYLIASQCHPSIFEALKDYKVILFHNATVGVKEFLEKLAKDDFTLYGGGTTVGIKAMVISKNLGFKYIHIYGMDSSYRGTDGHAYKQALNDGESVMDAVCGDQVFKASPWMIRQAQEFQEVAAELIEDDRIVIVAGDGLIPYIAKVMSSTT